MTPETDLLALVLALQMGFVTPEQVSDLGDAPTRSGSPSLMAALESRGFITAEARKALDAVVEVKVRMQAGDAERTLSTVPVTKEVFRTVLALPLPEGLRLRFLGWRHEDIVDGGPAVTSPSESTFLPATAETEGPTVVPGTGPPVEAGPDAGESPDGTTLSERYALREELGRGALGRVVEAVDLDFGREVAVKMMHPGFSAEAVERFLLEGRAAGRLPHPNIVPIYEIGVLSGPRGRTPFFTMAKIVGRDLADILSTLDRGDEDTVARFRRPRLLRIFQDVCNAMAFAHDQGVIHRDLKPANIMVGDYGEVFVVDWGLAKLLPDDESRSEGARPDVAAGEDPGREDGENQPDSRADQAPARPPTALVESLDTALDLADDGPEGDEDAPDRPTELTLEGQVLGTPSYMSPEQASGRRDLVDPLSDVYSLGAILYRILTSRPPFTGQSGTEIVWRVLHKDLPPPSVRSDRVRRQRIRSTGSRDVPFPEPVPAELDEICLRALARDRTARTPSARALLDDVEAFLDREKEKERNRKKALETVEEGRSLVARLASLREELAACRRSIRTAERTVKPSWPAEKKRDFWTLQDREDELGRNVVRTFSRAATTFQAALGFERDNPEARAALAELYWDQYLREEQQDDQAAMVLYESLVREFNDGQFDDLLQGDGTLTVTTRHYPCSCLRDGRDVPAHELDLAGYHPFSGRHLGGMAGVEGMPELEPAGRVRLRAHGPPCRTEPLTGVRVWLFRYAERDRILVPVEPVGVKGRDVVPAEVPPPVLDALFDRASPFRPGRGYALGTAPVRGVRIPMGSYLLVLAKEGYRPVRAPLRVDRAEDASVAVTLYGTDEVPDGFLQVPAGPFQFQGDPAVATAGARQTLVLDDFFLARFPVTCAEYLAFLNDLASRDPAQARARAPRKAANAPPYWPQDETGRFHLPTGPGEGSRLETSPVWWDESWPVYSISWEDVMSYAAWRRAASGYCLTLPLDLQWEKAGRGPDGRYFPWGNRLDYSFSNTNNSLAEGMRPCPVRSFPKDESPYGVRGMSGNSRDRCLEAPSADMPGWRLCRGGNWQSAGTDSHLSIRTGNPEAYVFYVHGGRLCLQTTTVHRDPRDRDGS